MSKAGLTDTTIYTVNSHTKQPLQVVDLVKLGEGYYYLGRRQSFGTGILIVAKHKTL